MKIAIYCSANNNLDTVFFEKTRELGVFLAKKRHSIVFGGCRLGLMECIAQATKEAGGETIGVVPDIIEENGKISHFVDQEIRCANLNERKQIIMENSDVCIALPGGIGTLDEIFTVAASASIGYHRQRVILYNIKGFWNPLISLLKDFSQKGVIRGEWRKQFLIAENISEIAHFIGQIQHEVSIQK